MLWENASFQTEQSIVTDMITVNKDKADLRPKILKTLSPSPSF